MAGHTSTSPRVILTTGSSRSLGLAMVHVLALRCPHDTFILTARSQQAADDAIAGLRAQGVTATIEGIVLEVDNDESIKAATEWIERKFGRLDVLINNAGIAHRLPATDAPADARLKFASTFSTNVASVYVLTTALLPLLRKSAHAPAVINISSARGSLTLSTTQALPPTASVPYSVSKTALNALTVEMAKAEPGVRFYAACPGHCRTALNGFAGKREPMEGAEVVAELVYGDGEWESPGCFETKGKGGKVEVVPW